MNKHEQLVRSIAEEMAKAVYSGIYERGSQSCKNSLIKQHKPAARIAVKHMAEAFKDGAIWSDMWVHKSPELYEEMKKLGLVPPTGEEAAEK